jgi:hypothetical protein
VSRNTQGWFAIGSLFLFAVWLLIVLPLIYLPSGQIEGGWLGVKPGEWLMFFATVLLFVATVGLWLATVRLVKGAEKTAERQLRAYISVTSKGLDEQSEVQERYAHYLELRNTGQTPAYDLKIESVTNSLTHPVPSEFCFPFDPPGANPSVMMLGAGLRAEHVSYADQILDDGELLLTKSPGSGHRVYTYGTVSYRDVFGRSRRTEFCYFLEWRFENLRDGKALPRIAVHPSELHNNAS